ncbi:hypothetical protein EC957_000427 [Mortierella hygrophila]|uniref:Uncharacterized protein n=1 Tax=Mortierella hygrophila TaxID=979708 RepID=A0A9P6F715_9FUNG|nr:hypothetical protein EC957_000427 [Mortierella hygrophila]
MGDGMMQPVQSPAARSYATSSNQFIQMPSNSMGSSAASGDVAAVYASRPPVPASPESVAIRTLKKRLNCLNLNAQTPSSTSSGPPLVASADIGTGTRTGPHDGGVATAASTAAAVAAVAVLTAAITQLTPKSSTHSNHHDNNLDNCNNGKKKSRRHKKDRDWKHGPPATLAPLSQPSSSLHHSTRHSCHHSRHHSRHHSNHHGQEMTGAGAGRGSGRTQRREGSVASEHGKGLATGSGKGWSSAEGPSSGGRKATGKGISGVHVGREIAGGGGGTITEATTAFGSNGRGNGARRRRKKEKERGGIGRKNNNHTNSGQAGWAPLGVGVQGSEGDQGGREYQRGPAGTETGIGMGATPGGGIEYSAAAAAAGIQEPGSSPTMQYHHHQDYQQQQQQQHQQYQINQQMRQSTDVYPGQHYSQQHPGQQQQGGRGARDKAIRSPFLQGIEAHSLQANQLTHLTFLRYEFLMDEFVEMIRLLPALQVLDLDIVSVPSCPCRTFSHPSALHHHRQQLQHASRQYRQSHDPSFPGHHFRAGLNTEAPYSRHSSQNDGSDNMDVDYAVSNPPSAATLCRNCIHRERIFRHSQGTSTAPVGPQDQFPTVRSLTFRGTAIVPELLALFPNLETLAFEEMRYRTPAATIGPSSVPSDALFDGSTCSQAHSRMNGGQSRDECGSSSFCTDSGDDSLDATAILSLEAGLTSPPSQQSVVISELAMMLKNHCPLLTRLVLNEPLLIEDLSREQLQLQNNSLLSSSIGPSPSVGSSQSHIYPVDGHQEQPSSIGRVQDQLALLLQVIPRLKQFVVHSRVAAKCPQLLDTLLEHHHPHLISFQVLDDSQDMSHYPSIQNPNATLVLPHQTPHHAFYSTQNIYDQQSLQQQQELYEQLGHQYHSTFVPFGSEPPAMQQQQQYVYPGGGLGLHGGDLPSSPSAQPSSLLYQALQTQNYLQQQTMLRLQASSYRILESCPNLQVFESKIPLLLQQLIGSVPRWACGSEIAVLWLEVEELTGIFGLDPEEEEVMQMFVRSLFKGSRYNTASSSPPQETTSSDSGEGDSSRSTTISPSPPSLVGATAVADIVSKGSSPFAAAVADKATAPATARFGSHLVEIRSLGTVSSSLGSAGGGGGVGETFPSPSPSSALGLPPGHGAPLSSNAWTSQGAQPVSSEPAVIVAPSPVAGVGAGIPSGWNKPLLPPPPPLAFTSPATVWSTMGGGASYAPGFCQIEGIERLMALQFLVEHQLVYLPKLNRFLMGNRMYTIPTRERVL